MKSKILAIVVLIVLALTGFVALENVDARKKKVLIPGYLGRPSDFEVSEQEVVMEVRDLPSPLPSRLRVVIQPNKGEVCFQCHKIPYPTAPTEPPQPGERALASILTTPPGGLRILTPVMGPFQAIPGGWSPDGKRILFWFWRTGNPELFLVNPDGTGLTQLTHHLAWDMFPAWSPDGEKIAFDSDRMGNFDIWVLELQE